MVVKSLGTLDTIRLKLSPFLPRPQAMLYFEHPVPVTLSCPENCLFIPILFGGGEGH